MNTKCPLCSDGVIVGRPKLVHLCWCSWCGSLQTPAMQERTPTLADAGTWWWVTVAGFSSAVFVIPSLDGTSVEYQRGWVREQVGGSARWCGPIPIPDRVRVPEAGHGSSI